MTITATSTWTILPYSRKTYEVTFSKAPADFLPCDSSFAKKVAKALSELDMDPGEERPSREAIAGVVGLVEKVSNTKSLFQPDVSAFYGEAILTWKFGKREVTLLSRGGADDPKMMKYESRDNRPSYSHVVPNVTADQLAKAIHYSLKNPGWLYE
jgi:hypothetical protein